MGTLLHDLLEVALDTRSDNEALVDGSRRFCYRDFQRAAATGAGVLAENRLDCGDRVVIYLDKSAEEAFSIFAISMAGGVFVPVNPLLHPRQVARILADCRARYLITNARRCEALAEVIDSVSSVECILLVDEPSRASAKRLVGRLFSQPAVMKTPRPGRSADPAAILYTSGSSGLPKGVVLSHANLLAGSRIVCAYLGIDSNERILSVLPLSFDYGLNQLITAVQMAATTILHTLRFGDDIVRAVRDERVTGLAGVPTLWAVLTQAAPLFAKERLPSLRYLTNSGGAVPTETLSRLRAAQPHVDVVLMYGFTEAFRSTYLPPTEVDRLPTSIGKAIPETEIFLLNHNGQRCGSGEEGILVHHGPTVSLGYWERPAETAALLRPHPFLEPNAERSLVCYSGDRVRMDDEGFLYFVGRDDALIKSAGYRISPTEVEEVLMNCGLLSQAAVIGLPDPTLGERVHAVCVPAQGNVDCGALVAHCACQLPSYMVPRAVELVASLPCSPNGKVDYRRLRELRVAPADDARSKATDPGQAPAGAMKRQGS